MFSPSNAHLQLQFPFHTNVLHKVPHKPSEKGFTNVSYTFHMVS